MVIFMQSHVQGCLLIESSAVTVLDERTVASICSSFRGQFGQLLQLKLPFDVKFPLLVWVEYLLAFFG